MAAVPPDVLEGHKSSCLYVHFSFQLMKEWKIKEFPQTVKVVVGVRCHSEDRTSVANSQDGGGQ